MPRVKRIAIAVGVFLLLFAAIGFLLPTAWQVERQVVIAAPAASVFPYINSLKRWREWTVWYQRNPELKTEYSGPEAGVGATSRWTDEDGRGALKIMQSEGNGLVAYTLLLNGGQFVLHGQITLLAEGAGTRVVWSATGATGRHPLARYAGLFTGLWVGSDLADSLALLKQKLEAKP
jgi:hypothetical protein